MNHAGSARRMVFLFADHTCCWAVRVRLGKLSRGEMSLQSGGTSMLTGRGMRGGSTGVPKRKHAKYTERATCLTSKKSRTNSDTLGVLYSTASPVAKGCVVRESVAWRKPAVEGIIDCYHTPHRRCRHRHDGRLTRSIHLGAGTTSSPRSTNWTTTGSRFVARGVG